MNLMLRYAQALIIQMAQTAACNRSHSLDQQLCRWLLLSLDRLRSNEFLMPLELISKMLGVRYQDVPEIATKLQIAGLIHYERDHITILDRHGLQKRGCECYAVSKNDMNFYCLKKTRPVVFNGNGCPCLYRSELIFTRTLATDKRTDHARTSS